MTQLHKHPLYIHFFNCSLNSVPEFLAKKKEIGIVIQKQFDDLEVNNRYINVVLYFDGRAYSLQIDMSTIYSIEVFGRGKLDFEHRLTKEYLSSIMEVEDNEYMNSIKEVAAIMYKQDKFIDFAKISEKTTKTSEVVDKIVNIDEIIGSHRND